jgi:zinc finger HIT domain-containing protein 1
MYQIQGLRKQFCHLEAANVALQEMVLRTEPMAARSRRRLHKQDWQTWTRRTTKTQQYQSHQGRRIKAGLDLSLTDRASLADLSIGKKITPNIRRILMYQRTFAHYLADEEAQLSQSGGSNTPTTAATTNKANSQRATATGAGPVAGPSTRTPSRAQQTPMPPPPRPRTASTSTPSNLKRESSTDLPAPTSTTPKSRTSTAATSQPPPSIGGSVALLPVNPALDNEPLLKSHIPKMPSGRVMEALLSEPPLTYNAARAKPLHNGTPVRYFCAICGYWGKVKCRKCGERTCGLMECWKGHETAGCTPY